MAAPYVLPGGSLTGAISHALASRFKNKGAENIHNNTTPQVRHLRFNLGLFVIAAISNKTKTYKTGNSKKDSTLDRIKNIAGVKIGKKRQSGNYN